MTDKINRCSMCYSDLPENQFYRQTKSKTGRQGFCKKCALVRNIRYREKYPEKYYTSDRRKKLRKRFGISISQYEIMCSNQENRCAICNKEETCRDCKGRLKRLAVDHCHTTNKIRGLLCQTCNTALGKFYDNITTLEKAIEYLKKNSI